MLMVMLGAMSILAAIVKAVSIFASTKRFKILGLIPLLLLCFYLYVNFLNYVSKDHEPELFSLFNTICAIFLLGGVLSYITLILIDKGTNLLASSRVELALPSTFLELPKRDVLVQKLAFDKQNKYHEFAILTLAINNFTYLQEIFGHSKTEKLFQEVCFKIQQAIDSTSIEAFHSQPNLFYLLVNNVNRPQLETFSEYLMTALEEPIVTDQLALKLKVSIGIALYPSQINNPEDLLGYSELTAFQAQANQPAVLFYQPKLSSPFRTNTELLTKLQQAITNNDFSLYFQRIRNVKKPECLCFEILIRWQVDGNFVSPAEFIPLAEQNNNIQAITRWVLAKSLKQLAIWQKINSDICLHINISSKDIQDDQLIDYLRRLLKKHALNPNNVTLEITETHMMQDVKRSRDVLFKIRELGVKLSIDDYGSGFSSLSILSEMPIDEIKIDRSFVTHIMTKKNHMAIVRSTIELAHKLQCEVVAEGIEDANVANYLISMGCDKLQGYYFNRPISLKDTTALIKEHSAQQVLV